ncbi:hypothetical protein GCM10010987_80080 [Bradyrhizobium guangdongense]|uniref:Uncharacterized protein n=1 Tax=Bradyrhizobium guangdongense TaxID=1325090 RepID=A0AA87WCD1_9BRAD|nr:hypothetical protein GCM10010987_80080 [Bradyrhizobium guangdongense]
MSERVKGRPWQPDVPDAVILWKRKSQLCGRKSATGQKRRFEQRRVTSGMPPMR